MPHGHNPRGIFLLSGSPSLNPCLPTGFAGDDFRGAARPGNQFNESLSCLPARKRGCLDGLMVISSPVWGLRPLPPARVATTNTPKPVRRTSSPAFKEEAMRSNTPSTALAASFLGRPVVSESFWMRSFLFMGMLLTCLGDPAAFAALAGLPIRPLFRGL